MTKITLDLAGILKRKHPHGFHAPADLEIDTFLEFADDDWEYELDVHELLAERQQIGDIWCVEDVLSVRPDLTDDEAWEVLLEVKRHHDANFGITWDVVEHHADQLYPEPEVKAFEVRVATRTNTVYRVEAPNARAAERRWAEGDLIRSDDATDGDVLGVTEVVP